MSLIGGIEMGERSSERFRIAEGLAEFAKSVLATHGHCRTELRLPAIRLLLFSFDSLIR